MKVCIGAVCQIKTADFYKIIKLCVYNVLQIRTIIKLYTVLRCSKSNTYQHFYLEFGKTCKGKQEKTKMM